VSKQDEPIKPAQHVVNNPTPTWLYQVVDTRSKPVTMWIVSTDQPANEETMAAALAQVDLSAVDEVTVDSLTIAVVGEVAGTVVLR
jgi:hypothetical protein